MDTRRSEASALRIRGSKARRDGEAASELDGRVSRRWLLSKAGAAAVGTVAAGALLLRDTREVKAPHDPNMDDDISVAFVKTHALRAETIEDIPAVLGQTGSGSWGAVQGDNSGAGSGVVGLSAAGAGVYGEPDTNARGAVEGSNTGTGGYGVWGNSSGIGVYGSGKTGVSGEGTGSTTSGVLGSNANAVGVAGNGKIGISGLSSAAGFPAVYGQHTGTAGGYGVRGTSNSGYGGLFQAGKTQLRLVPGSTAGKPTSGAHTKGRYTWTPRGRCWCARPAAPQARGRRSPRPQSESRIPPPSAGRGLVVPALCLAFIHPSAWKWHSPKLAKDV